MYTPPASLMFRSVRELAASIIDQLRQIGLESREPSCNGVVLAKLNAAPAKTIEGMVALADGVNWNPGAGAGFYGYHSGAWNKLG